ncbi:MAG: hypothetical protein HN353_04350 [Bdellovibrionales bacterium]|nr:hypothetical protein [Bdellovibrionales bacterium]MBT3526485.1 hypothetical protein [Bdellovibrionales bacterium]MBT7668055.1 hypothetical protein [Bdellovibrionales bacterium]MBT7766853.1 hypothetical protein [Bdellovibrionales bacterium]
MSLKKCWDSTNCKQQLKLLFVIALLIVIEIFPVTAISSERKFSAEQLLSKFSKLYQHKHELTQLQNEVLQLGGAAVPTIILVMKDGKYPDKNRWVATFLLGRIMGKSASPFIAKFLDHPNWVMRLASLKTMLAIKADQYGVQYAKALADRSMLVRLQALENVRKLRLSKQGRAVWKMLFNGQNYYQTPKSKKARKRTPIIGKAIRTLGDLNYQIAEKALLKMVVNQNYNDIFEPLNYSLSKITGKIPPQGDKREDRRKFWQGLLAAK